jgi:histone deacetylase 11
VDVHQGNGTATIFARDESVFTFSMQEEGIYPLPRATSALDVELPAGTGDEEFLRILASHLPAVLDGTAPDARHGRATGGPPRPRPDIVLIQGGCDTLAGDPLAHLAMTPEGIVRRDAMIIDA